MTDYDVDEPVAPLKGRKAPENIFADYALTASGLALALLAAFFPWYVFYNEDQFAYRISSQILSRDLPELPSRGIVNAAPSAIPDSDAGTTTPLAPDNVLTGTVPQEPAKVSEPDVASEAGKQPFPHDVSFTLLHVANGRAMIEDAHGIYLVGIGSPLPDGSQVATLQQQHGRWVIVTNTGKIITPASNGGE